MDNEGMDDKGLEHFVMSEENAQLVEIIDSVARSMGLENWADLETIAKKARDDCDRLRKLHKIMAQESCPATPQHLQTFDEFRVWIDGLPDIA